MLVAGLLQGAEAGWAVSEGHEMSGLLLAATGNLNAYLLQGCKLSSSDRYRDASDDSFSEPGLAELEIR